MYDQSIHHLSEPEPTWNRSSCSSSSIGESENDNLSDFNDTRDVALHFKNVRMSPLVVLLNDSLALQLN